MEFEITQAIKIIETMLSQNRHRSDYDFLMDLKRKLEQQLQEQEEQTCGFCIKPCGNDYCVTKENK